MRYTPAALALSLLVAVTGSMGSAHASDPLDPRAQVLFQDGRTQLAKGDVEGATDSLESALTIDPANANILVALGDASRQAGLQGKAIHYYRDVLDREPNNLAAIAGEGAALAEKGAIDKAKATLARLEGLCGKACPETAVVSRALAAGPKPQVAAAEPVAKKDDVQAN